MRRSVFRYRKLAQKSGGRRLPGPKVASEPPDLKEASPATPLQRGHPMPIRRQLKSPPAQRKSLSRLYLAALDQSVFPFLARAVESSNIPELEDILRLLRTRVSRRTKPSLGG